MVLARDRPQAAGPAAGSTAGMGWDRPADPADPENGAKNRRMEIKVYPAEATAAAK